MIPMTQENVAAKNLATQSSTLDLAFALSLIGGIFIALGSILGMGLAAMGRPFFWGMGRLIKKGS